LPGRDKKVEVETKLKQRVTGAIVLTTLAIIVLPMLLDGSAEDRARISTAIPPAPVINVKNLSIREVKQAMREMEQQSAAKLPVYIEDQDIEEPDVEDQEVEHQENEPSGNGATAQADAADYQLDVNDLPVSWTLQLGSFKQQDNAVKLRQSLREARFRTYILTAQSAEGQVYRVYVGPMLSKNALADYAVDIEARFALKGRIIRYRIAQDANQLGG
jgi:DedD protein